MIPFLLCIFTVTASMAFFAGCAFASGIAFDNGYRAGRRSAISQPQGYTVVDR